MTIMNLMFMKVWKLYDNDVAVIDPVLKRFQNTSLTF